MDNNPFNSLNKKQEKNNENNQIDKTSINTYFNQYPLNTSKKNLNNLILKLQKQKMVQFLKLHQIL